MFVEIKNEDDAIKLAGWINRTRNDNKGVITPEFAMEVLKKTNHSGNLKTVIATIKNCCSVDGVLVKSKLVEYRDFILSAICGRTHTSQVYNGLKELAEVSGVKELFDNLDAEGGKIYGHYDCRIKNFHDWLRRGITDFSDCDIAVLSDRLGRSITFQEDFLLPRTIDTSSYSMTTVNGSDLSKVERIIVDSSSKTKICNCSKFNKKLDFCGGEEVKFSACDFSATDNLTIKGAKALYIDNREGITNISNVMPRVFDVSDNALVKFDSCDFALTNELKLKENSHAIFINCSNLPRDLDIPSLEQINISGYDLSKLDNVKFADDSQCTFSNCSGFASDFDVSPCKKVVIFDSDLDNIENMTFKEGAEVLLVGINKWPKNIDFSKCSKVHFSKCDLNGVENIKFAEGSEVSFTDMHDIPNTIDFSVCGKASFVRSSLHSFEEIKFGYGSEVSFLQVDGIPNIDVSLCNSVDMAKCDLRCIENTKFKEGSEVKLNNKTGDGRSFYDFPTGLDFSLCKKVDLTGCVIYANDECLHFASEAEVIMKNAHLQGVELDFGDGSKINLEEAYLGGMPLNFGKSSYVKLRGAKNYPKFLDVSECLGGDIGGDFTGLNIIKFKNEDQRIAFCKGGAMLRNGIGDSYVECLYADKEKAKEVVEETAQKVEPEKIDVAKKGLFEKIRDKFGMGGM